MNQKSLDKAEEIKQEINRLQRKALNRGLWVWEYWKLNRLTNLLKENYEITR